MEMFTKFLSIGAIATLIQYVLLTLLVELFDIAPYIASGIGYIISAIFNYFANYYFSFASNASHISAMSKFFIVVLIGLLINSAIVFFLTDFFQFHYILSQLIATGVVTLSNFVLLKNWAYN